MRTLYSVCLGAMFALLINAAPVRGAEPIVYVSGTGNDGSLCTLAAPCRTFQRAVSVVLSNGVVQVLNSASYGNVTINKSLTISGGGNVVGLGTRITINNASAIVVLRGLVMDGRRQGTGLNGILISAAAAVHIKDCEIERYSGSGIRLVGTSATELFVSDTVSRDSVGHGLDAANGNALVAINDSRFDNNIGMGVWLIVARASIVRSEASGNQGAGVRLDGTTADIINVTSTDNSTGFDFRNGASVTLSSSAARGNTTGMYIFSSSISITENLFVSNPTAIQNQGGTLYTRQNNTLGGNYIGDAAVAFGAF